MRFWWREVSGWALVALGLFTFYKCYEMLTADQPALVQAGPLVVVGIIVFRAGVQLLKVAVAARICGKAQEQAAARPKAAPPRPRRLFG
ncbi:MAG TPA: hypothetical protein VFA26_13460 [Gemmataceae bacterium]|nr:hypothetical protein [Gemmataceae bacterium]